MTNLVSSDTVYWDESIPGEAAPRTRVQECQVSVTHPDPVDETYWTAVTGTGDPDLNPASGEFVAALGQYAEAANPSTAFTVLPDGRVQVNFGGWVRVDGYADFTFTLNNSTVGVAFSIERAGSTVYSPRSVHAKQPNAGDIGHLSGGGMLEAQAGDIIGVSFASDNTGTIKLRSSSLIFNYRGV